MSRLHSSNATSNDINPCPEDMFPGKILAVTDRGMQKTSYGPKHVVCFHILTNEPVTKGRGDKETPLTDDDGNVQWNVVRFNAPFLFTPRSKLAGFLSKLLSKTVEEVCAEARTEEGIDLFSFIGTDLKVSVEHYKTQGGQTRAGIDGISKLKRSDKPVSLEGGIVGDMDAAFIVEDFDTMEDPEERLFNAVPEFLDRILNAAKRAQKRKADKEAQSEDSDD